MNKYNVWKLYSIICIIVIIILSICCISLCKNTDYSPVEKIVYVPVQDTVSERTNIATIIRLEHDLALTQDSLAMAKDSIGEDLIVARIKLARIKEYNRIAAKGNNIKYLRGWINRVLENE